MCQHTYVLRKLALELWQRVVAAVSLGHVEVIAARVHSPSEIVVWRASITVIVCTVVLNLLYGASTPEA